MKTQEIYQETLQHPFLSEFCITTGNQNVHITKNDVNIHIFSDQLSATGWSYTLNRSDIKTFTNIDTLVRKI